MEIGVSNIEDGRMKYDDAKWHYGGDFPKDSPNEYGGTHIALFLKWCFQKGWAGSLHIENKPEAVEDVINGNISATDFFFRYCDGKLTNEDLSEEGNRFANAYYGGEGLYFSDFVENFGDLMYTAPEDKFSFREYSKMLDKRYRSGTWSNKNNDQ